MSQSDRGSSLLVAGGRVVTPTDERVADVFLEGNRVVAIGPSLDRPADRRIDARGKLVFAGCVDVHVHVDAPFAGTRTCDDYRSASVAAAFGGTTTLIDFCEPQPDQTLLEALATYRRRLARQGSVVGIGLHMVVDRWDSAIATEIPSLSQEGITSLKLYLAYKGSFQVDDETLFRAMQAASEVGSLVMVHAENGDVIEVLTQQARLAGRLEPRYLAVTRPPEVEAEAVNRAIVLAGIAGCALYVVHVSGEASLEPLVQARAAGAPVWGETCTHYLFADVSDLDRPWHEAATRVFSPPPRRASDRDRLWKALAADELSVVSSDHAPFHLEGGKSLGRDDFSKIPGGVPGVEERLALIHQFGVRTGRISLSRMVDLLAAAPAKLFGLYPQKGCLEVGADADLVIFDPHCEHRLSARTHHSKCDHNTYEGMTVSGKAESVVVGGNVVIDHGELVPSPPYRRHLHRKRFTTPFPGLGEGARQQVSSSTLASTGTESS